MPIVWDFIPEGAKLHQKYLTKAGAYNERKIIIKYNPGINEDKIIIAKSYTNGINDYGKSTKTEWWGVYTIP